MGDKLPDVQLDELVDGSPTKVALLELFKGKKGVLFGVPGSYTPGCSKVREGEGVGALVRHGAGGQAAAAATGVDWKQQVAGIGLWLGA